MSVHCLFLATFFLLAVFTIEADGESIICHQLGEKAYRCAQPYVKIPGPVGTNGIRRCWAAFNACIAGNPPATSSKSQSAARSANNAATPQIRELQTTVQRVGLRQRSSPILRKKKISHRRTTKSLRPTIARARHRSRRLQVILCRNLRPAATLRGPTTPARRRRRNSARTPTRPCTQPA